MRIAVIGAGPSGITAAKNLLQAGLRDVVVYDRNAEVGGNWIYSPEPSHSSVFETTHIISSRTLSEYEDYPWPKGTCDYPGHRELRAYFQGYARRFSVVPLIRFGTEVRRAELGGGRPRLAAHPGLGRAGALRPPGGGERPPLGPALARVPRPVRRRVSSTPTTSSRRSASAAGACS